MGVGKSDPYWPNLPSSFAYNFWGFILFKEIVFWMSCSYGRRMRVNVYDKDIDALQNEVEKGEKINHMA